MIRYVNCPKPKIVVFALFLSCFLSAAGQQSNPAYFLEQAKAFRDKGQYDSAINYSGRVINLDKKNSSAYSVRAGAYFFKGSHQQALDDVNQAIRLQSSNSEAYY